MIFQETFNKLIRTSRFPRLRLTLQTSWNVFQWSLFTIAAIVIFFDAFVFASYGAGWITRGVQEQEERVVEIKDESWTAAREQLRKREARFEELRKNKLSLPNHFR